MKKYTTIVISLILFCTVFLFTGNLLIAGTTGKITGKVIDVSTKEALPGTNVVLEGTSMGAATDMDGNYTILNIPPGIYSLKFTMMGYKNSVITDVRVSIDLTTTIDVDMNQTVLEAEETVTVVAERPLVRADMTSALSSVGADEIAKLPVQNVNDVLEIQAGIIQSIDGFHIRGGRAAEVAYWVDGVATTDVYSGGIGVAVENSAVQELQVVSGTFNAEYGQAMSGIVNIITKEGGKRYTGEITGYVGDYVGHGSVFDVLKSVEVTKNAANQTVAIGHSENPLAKFNPTYNAELSLNGPFPLTKDKLSFFLNGRYYSTEGALYGREWYTPMGTPGDSSIVPLSPTERLTTQAKLTYKLSSNIKLNYGLFWSKWQNDRANYINDLPTLDRNTYTGHNFKYNPGGLPAELGESFTHIFSLNHVLSPKTFYEFRINRFQTEYKRYVYEDPLATPDYLVHVLADTTEGLTDYYLDISVPEDSIQFVSAKEQGRQYEWVIDPSSPLGYVHPDSNVAPSAYSFFKTGQWPGHFERNTSYWIGKWDLTSQIQKAHQLKTGVELRLYEMELHSFTIRPKLDANGQEITPFQPAIPDESSYYRSDYTKKPKEFSAYIQDKIELKEMNINIGLRFDYFDANSTVIADPTDPSIYSPLKNEHIYKNWVEPPDTFTAVQINEWKQSFEQYTPDERRSFMHKKVDPKMALSPRLGIAYPITDRGVIHFSYGHFFQVPEFRYLYENPDFKVLPAGGTNYIFGNADLKPQLTVMYEIGLQQQLSDNIGVDITIFYRDVRNWVGISPLIETVNPSLKYNQYENRDYSNVRGITLKFEKRQSQHFSVRADYTYQLAEGTYSSPRDGFTASQNNNEPRLSLIPMSWDQRHTFNGSIIYQLKDWTVSLIGSYWSGRPYTPTFATGGTTGETSLVGLVENSSRMSYRRNVDLSINRRIKLGTIELNAFINVYNLFNQLDDTYVYTDTGSPDYTTTIVPEKIGYSAYRVGTVQDYINHPDWHAAPRQVQVGMSMGF
jgi:outer membrane receptor for ferrienterochelin and colicin